ncbi:hypothetical protein RE628_00825 [Paenibacillus sp. D2_2]|nr:hypothetical protein [Paenibacillus sp. D2_2]WMT41198.1 hypothetical protein RE628_00825 [Paenibacillus sp. D2_2]
MLMLRGIVLETMSLPYTADGSYQAEAGACRVWIGSNARDVQVVILS